MHHSKGNSHGITGQSCPCRLSLFQVTPNLATFVSMSSEIVKRLKLLLDLPALFSRVWANKRLSAVLAVAFVIGMYVLFNNKGIIQRVKLERERKEMIQKIQQAEKEQKQLQEQSKALEGDKKAVEKVAREKYGMVREGEKVYRVAPKK